MMEFVEGPVIRGPEQAAAFPPKNSAAASARGLVETMAKDPFGRRNEGWPFRPGPSRRVRPASAQALVRSVEKSKTRELPLVEDVPLPLGRTGAAPVGGDPGTWRLPA